MSGGAAARRRALAFAAALASSALVFGVVFGVLFGAVAGGACVRDRPARAADPARASDLAPVTAAPRTNDASVLPALGYTVMDVQAIQRAVHGRGRPVLVHFWASWCGPCLEELPLVETFARDMKARGIDVLSLSLDDAGRAGAHVVEVLSRRAPSLTRNIVHVDDPDAFINTVDPQWEGSIPAVFAYDEHGRLRGRLIGEATRRDLDALVARVAKPGR